MAVRPKAKRANSAPSRPAKQSAQSTPPSTSALPSPAPSPPTTTRALQPAPPPKPKQPQHPAPAAAKHLAQQGTRHPPSSNSAHRRSSSSHTRLKRPPPAAPADGSAAPPVPRKLPLPPDGSVKTCEAVDRYESRCAEVVVGGWKGKVKRRWCQMHEDEEKHVRGSFWNAVSSLPRLSRSSPLPTPSQITSSSSFAELESWEKTARQHIDLAKRAYGAWTFHREHFWAAGGDLVDRLEGRGEAEGGGDLAKGAWEEVRLRGEKAEAALKLIIRRSHFLVCDAEDALWLLHPHSAVFITDRLAPGECNGLHGHCSDSSDDEDDGESCGCSHSHCDEGHSHGEGGEHCGCAHDHVHEDGDECCSACSSHRSQSSPPPRCCDGASHSSFSATAPPHHSQQPHPPPPQHANHHLSPLSSGEKAPHNPLRPPGSPTLAPENEEPDPLVALETLRRTELLELLSLTGSHASFIKEGRKSVERVRIVECLFRRLIARDEELLVKAYRGGHDHVLRFFEDPLLVSLPALIRLHRNLQRTTPVQLKEAIMDAFRAIAWEESGATETEEGEEGVGMQVLGGWVYKKQLERSMTPREWGHLYDLCACPGCATKCCMRFTDLTLIRRLTVIPHGPHPPPFELWAEDGADDAASDAPEGGNGADGGSYEPDAHRIFKALDIVWCAGKEEDDDGKVRKMKPSGKDGGTLWSLREERNWAFLKMSLTHPHALSILTLLSQFFTLLVRSRLTPSHALPSFPLPPASHLWTQRIRTATTKAALSRPPPASSPSTNAWRALPNPFNLALTPSHTLAGFDALDSPEKEQNLPPFEGTYELLILDAPSSTPYATAEAYLARPLEAFENFLAAVVAQGVGIKVPASITPLPGKNGELGGGGVDVQPAMSALTQQALEHGAVESFLKGDLVWDFGDVRGVTTPGRGKFGGVDLKKAGKEGIVAPQGRDSGDGGGGGGKYGAWGPDARAEQRRKIVANGGGGGGAKKGGAATGGAGGEKKAIVPATTAGAGKVSDGMRDDRLALRLSRSLFR